MFYFRLTGTSQGEGVSFKHTIFKKSIEWNSQRDGEWGWGLVRPKKTDFTSSKEQMF